MFFKSVVYRISYLQNTSNNIQFVPTGRERSSQHNVIELLFKYLRYRSYMKDHRYIITRKPSLSIAKTEIFQKNRWLGFFCLHSFSYNKYTFL